MGTRHTWGLLSFYSLTRVGLCQSVTLHPFLPSILSLTTHTMFQTRNEYDRGVNTFSPEGRLFQVEYAMEAIKLGSTAVGICTPEGVVLAVEKRITSPLMVASSVEKIMEIDSHIGAAMSGLTADARTLVEHARVECQNHGFTYNESIPVLSVTQSICDMALRFGETGDDDDDDAGGMSRPFGVALLLAGWDPAEDGEEKNKTGALSHRPERHVRQVRRQGDRKRGGQRADAAAGKFQERHDASRGGDACTQHAQGCDGGEGHVDERGNRVRGTKVQAVHG